MLEIHDARIELLRAYGFHNDACRGASVESNVRSMTRAEIAQLGSCHLTYATHPCACAVMTRVLLACVA
jgi:hypothetical protein